jgi:hypothetical protein
MATLRTVLNRVLGAIGEDQIDASVTDLNDTYHLQVLEFLNQIKEEIEGATQWRSLWTTISATVDADDTSATLTGTTERSAVVRVQDAEHGQFIPLLFNVTDAATPLQGVEVDLREMYMSQMLDPVTTNARPQAFSIDDTGGSELILQIFPKASVANSYSGKFFVPQAAMESDDLDTDIKIPERVLVQGVMWYALQERGEEFGSGSLWTEERYRKALDDAVSTDETARGGLQLVAT